MNANVNMTATEMNAKSMIQRSHDAVIVGTVSKLIDLYKAEFGGDWINQWAATVKISL